MSPSQPGPLHKPIVFVGMPSIDYGRIAAILDELGVQVTLCRSAAEVESVLAVGLPRAVVINPADDGAIRDLDKPVDESYYIVFLDARSDDGNGHHGQPPDRAIEQERGELQRLRKYAMAVVDTSLLSDEQLRHRLRESVELSLLVPENRPRIEVVTFGFKYGPPQDLHLLFDARVLPNPFWVEELRDGNGLDQAVYDYVMSAETSLHFVDAIAAWIEWSTPLYWERQQHQLQVGIGCTGGKHRSVAVGRAVEERLTALHFLTLLRHRDLTRTSVEEATEGAPFRAV